VAARGPALADTAGLANADRQGIYEPQALTGSAVLAKLAKRVAPPSVKQHLAAQRPSGKSASRRGGANRPPGSRGSARSSPQAKRSAANAASAWSSHPTKPLRRTAASSHAGDCEQQWGSAYDESDDANDPEEALDEAA
jgi:hypothetical protein